MKKEVSPKTKKKRKIFVLVGFCLLLVLTGTINILINNYALAEAKGANADNIVVGNFFTNYRTDRVSTRAQEQTYLDAIIASSSTSAEARANAEAQKDILMKAQTSEALMERMILAKGFSDAVTSYSNGNVSVIVKAKELTKAEVAQIVEIVQTQTGLDIDNIKIIPVE